MPKAKQTQKRAGVSREAARDRSEHDGPVLITGGSGFVGANLAQRFLAEGRSVILYDNLSRPGVEANARWLAREYGARVRLVIGDVLDAPKLRELVGMASAVFHFAAQVAVTTSLVEPMHDFEVNVRGTLHVLEALRRLKQPPPLLYTSTNKVYGSLPDVALVEQERRYVPADERLRSTGIDEQRALDFHSPYGCSKGAADQYVIDYARSFGLPAAVFRMSCIYGPRQFGTEDQGWVAHFLLRAAARQPITIYGNGKQVRDLLYIGDLVEAMHRAERQMDRLAGQAFNIGGGPRNVISLLELVGRIAELTGQPPSVSFEGRRTGDQYYYVSNTGKFEQLTGWRPAVSVAEGVDKLFAWLTQYRLEQSRSATAGGTEVAQVEARFVTAAVRRVLMTADPVGGVWTYALDLSRALGEFGVEVVLATMGRLPTAEQRAEAAQVATLELVTSSYKLEWMDDPWPDVTRAGGWLLELERRYAPQVVHLNSYAHGVLPFSAPTLIVGHSCVLSWWQAVKGEPAPARYHGYAQHVRDGLAAVERVVTPTRAMLAVLERHYGRFASGAVLANGCDGALFAPREKRASIVAAGRLWDEAKNLALLGQIASALSWPVRVAGDAAPPEATGGRVRLAPTDNLTLTGPLSRAALAELFGHASIYAFPARYEPFGLSVLEAASAGAALVLGDITSLRELWDGAARFVPVDDGEALIAAIEELVRDAPARAALSRAARQRARGFSLRRFGYGYFELYEQLVREGRGDARARVAPAGPHFIPETSTL